MCYAFNNKGENCSRSDCSYAHVCGRCFAKNVPMYDCSHKK